jgi:hypothetical protein
MVLTAGVFMKFLNYKLLSIEPKGEAEASLMMDNAKQNCLIARKPILRKHSEANEYDSDCQSQTKQINGFRDCRNSLICSFR